MIDLHHHLIWGVDDGPKDLETSLAMATEAARDGVTDIICTPHANFDYAWNPSLVEERFHILKEKLAGVIHLHPGCEFHMHYDNITDALAHPPKYSLGGKGYLLIEFPEQMIPDGIDTALYQLQSAGYTLVVAHPERCPALQANPRRLSGWLQHGVLSQLTAGSLHGRFGKRAEAYAKELLKTHQVHFVASDAHHPQWRPPHLKATWELVARSQGREFADLLFVHNPKAALLGKELPEQPSAANASGYAGTDSDAAGQKRGLLGRISGLFSNK